MLSQAVEAVAASCVYVCVCKLVEILAKVRPQKRHSFPVLIFDFLVVFISTCLVTVTPQCILFSEVVKKDSKVKLQIGDTL